MSQKLDERFMRLALSLGQRGQGQTWPNPSVGCVIVKNERIVGRGWTQLGGRPHAEPVALAQAGDDARGGTVYVTLEPCAHHGQTGPCANALVDSGVARCVIGCVDPDQRVAGQGIKILDDAGIETDISTLADQAEQAHRGFFKRLANNKPCVTLKVATTLDGKIATQTGESKWITGPAARRCVHVDRARHDAIMIGGGTARADNPTLTARGLGGVRQPVRIIISNAADFDGAALRDSLDQAPVWIFHAKESDVSGWVSAGAQCFAVPSLNGEIDLPSVLETCAAQGITSIYAEGGGQLAASLLKQDLVNDFIQYTAGTIIGNDGRAAIADLGLDRLSTASRWTLHHQSWWGPDCRTHWTRD